MIKALEHKKASSLFGNALTSKNAALFFLFFAFVTTSCANQSRALAPSAATPIVKQVWHARTVDPVYLGQFPIEHAQPSHARSSDQLVVASSSGFMTVYKAANGEEIWRKKFDDSFYAGALAVSDQVFIGSLDGFVRALSLLSGEEIWKKSLGASLESVPAHHDGRIFISDTANGLHALDASTGEVLWSHRRDPPTFFTIRGTCKPEVNDGVLYCGFSDGYLGAFQIDTGDVLWSVNLSDGQTEFTDINDEVFVTDDTVFAASYSGGVYALNREDGTTIWHNKVRGVADFALSFDSIFIATSNKLVARIARDSGEADWSFKFKKSAPIDVLHVGDYLFATTANGPVFVFDGKTGYPFEKWMGTNGSSAPPTWAANRLYFLTDAGEVVVNRIGWKLGK